MNYVEISNYKISEISLGLANIGIKNSEEEAFRLLDLFRDIGGNFVDTARIYSDWHPGIKGRSEYILGRYMKENKKPFIISTKGGHYNLLDITKTRITQKDLQFDLEMSLTALGVEVIDFYWLHRDNEETNIEEIIGWLEGFKKAGKIIEYGCSNWNASRIRESFHFTLKGGYSGFTGNQTLFNINSEYIKSLKDKTMTFMSQDMLALHKEFKMPVFAYSPFGAGALFKNINNLKNESTYIEYEQNSHEKKPVFYSKEDLIEKSLSFFLKEQSFPVIPILGINNGIQLMEVFEVYSKL